jgi:UDP-N-acetylglucosamine 1-carboxyvinyltransferase
MKMLQKMGAIVELCPPRTITIEGVEKLHGVTNRVLADRNEAVSMACLAIATNGRILLKGAIQEHLITFLNVVRRLGGEYEVTNDGIAFWKASEALRPLEVRTDVHPGFMTDWQQPLGVLLTQTPGISTIHETIYEDRFAYAMDLKEMGANIKVTTECPPNDPCRLAGKGAYHFAVIEGATTLSNKNLLVRDLRSGMVDILAALVANGTSEVEGVEEIDRGYERIDERLRQLGADITRV